MFDNNISPRAAHGIMKKIYYAVLFIPPVFLVVAYFFTDNINASGLDMEEPLNMVLVVFIALTVPTNSFLLRRIFSRVKDDDDTNRRLSVFFTGWLIRLGVYEGIEWFAIIVFMITGNLLVLLFTAIAIFAIANSYPRPSWIRQAVGVKEMELL